MIYTQGAIFIQNYLSIGQNMDFLGRPMYEHLLRLRYRQGHYSVFDDVSTPTESQERSRYCYRIVHYNYDNNSAKSHLLPEAKEEVFALVFALQRRHFQQTCERFAKCHVFVFPGPPVEVGVTMYVLSISSLSEVQMVQIPFSQFYELL